MPNENYNYSAGVNYTDLQYIFTLVPKPGANPTIAIYNASAVKSSLVRFETKQVSSNLKKRSSLCTTTLAL
jgi:hypothetical protein